MGVEKTLKRTTSLTVVLLALFILNLWPHPTVIAQGIPDYRFGVVEAYDAPVAATALGAGWTRATFEWNRIQTNGPESLSPHRRPQ